MLISDKLLAYSSVAPSGCREWQRARQPNGYGRVYDGTKARFAHRVAYETWVGPIPDGHDVHHVCCNRACILPEHLMAVTRAENLRAAGSMSRAARGNDARCARGHLFTPATTYTRSNGTRSCRVCRRARRRAK